MQFGAITRDRRWLVGFLRRLCSRQFRMMETNQLDMVCQEHTHIVIIILTLTHTHIQIALELFGTKAADRYIQFGNAHHRHTHALSDDTVVLINDRQQDGGISGTALYKKTAPEGEHITVVAMTGCISLLRELVDIIRRLREEDLMATGCPDVSRIS